MSKKSVEVKIAGHQYKIRSESDEESLRQIALYVDQAMQRVREGTGTADSYDVAVLTCLNLGRELIALKNSVSPDAADAKSASLRSLIERVESACSGAVTAGTRGQAADASAKRGAESASSAANTSGASGTSEISGADSAATIDFASIESFPEPVSEDADSDEALPETRRMAAGGRDRAS